MVFSNTCKILNLNNNNEGFIVKNIMVRGQYAASLSLLQSCPSSTLENAFAVGTLLGQNNSHNAQYQGKNCHGPQAAQFKIRFCFDLCLSFIRYGNNGNLKLHQEYTRKYYNVDG